MSYESFINSLTDNELMYLIYRELGLSGETAAKLLGKVPQASDYFKKSVQAKARKHHLREALA